MKAADHSKIVQQFDSLPNDSIVSDAVAARVLNVSERTVRRGLPISQVQITARKKGRRVGDLRALIRGESPQGAA